MPANQSPNLAADTETLKELYAAINRNDIQAALSFFDPQIERVEQLGFPTPGTYRGLAEMKEHLSKGRGTWAEGGCYPEKFEAIGGKIVVYLHVHVRLKEKQEWIDGRIADVFAFRAGKITQMYSFSEAKQALEWAENPGSNATQS